MSSRAVRRALGTDPLAAAAAEESDDSDTAQDAPATGNAFLALLAAQGSDSDSDNDDGAAQGGAEEGREKAQAQTQPSGGKSKKSKKKKKKKGGSAAAAATASSAAAAAADKPGQQPQPQKEDEEEEDEVDRAVREVQRILNEPATAAAAAANPTIAEPAGFNYAAGGLLSISPRDLNVELEMARKFHRGVAAASGRRGGAAARPGRLRGRAVRSMLATPKDTWPRMERAGLGMVVDRRDERTGDTFFRFTHNSVYQSVQLAFLRAVRTMDPAAITHVLRSHAYHIDSLLQLSEVCKMSGDLATAGDLIDRALYALEASFHPLFKVVSGRCRLDYKVYENRAMYLAVYRHMEFAVQRGCWRSAMELCKLLLSFDPDEDPLGALLWIDYLSLRASEYGYLRAMCEAWRTTKSLDWLPNFAYGEALAYFMEAHECDDVARAEQLRAQGSQQLQTALLRFPSVLEHILEKCRAHLHGDILQHPHFAPRTALNASERNVEMLAVLYAERTYTLYNAAQVLEWVQENAFVVISGVDGDSDMKFTAEAGAKRRKTHYPKAPLNIQRQVVLTENRSLLAFLPAEVTRNAVLAYDPLPPPDAPSPYDERLREQVAAETAAARPTAGLGLVGELFRSLLPGYTAEYERQVLAQQGRDLGPDVQAGALQQRLRDMLGGLNFAELFNRGSGEEGEAVQDPALYFEGADAEDLALLEDIAHAVDAAAAEGADGAAAAAPDQDAAAEDDGQPE